MNLFKRDIYLRTLLAACALMLSACESMSTIDIEGSYPSPLASKLPLTIGVYYSDDLRNYSYIEINERTGSDQYLVNSGSSQVALFNTMLPALFESVIIIEDINSLADYPGLDAVFTPAIEEFQIGLPAKTRLDLFEVWVKYNMRLTKPNGDYIADWLMTAYGKSPKDSSNSVDDGLNGAANIALRDLAASFTLGFNRIPEISEWLNENKFQSEQI
jgi:hypothetical protein